ncbi:MULTISPECIES: TIGR02285 family protein [Pseudomonas]|uniref:TIGR02285 family protein n=1 Tax=Pseudomonas aphyarum TaxID=2942629 RepID=A0ABT5PLL7_9PSED|nr:TIGR02285 family protein [Pseudomonas aphyarum]MDD0971441.1 TIGR02285 family protein [Pseudomonas aphyarum]MDD1124791.1 TIGR02285 family protein [Pseudomonas aphyarum]
MPSASNRAHHWWTWRLFGLLFLLVLPTWAQAKPTLIWLLRDLPPLTIFEGPKKGQGVIDQLMPMLIAGMPQYEHTLMRVNRARGIQMLHEHPFACDPSLIWNKERAQWIAFSIPAFRAVSNGLVVRQRDREVLEPFLVEGEVDLSAFLANGERKVGVVAERSYGEYIDTLLHQAPSGALTPHYGNDALSSLLSMQRLGRLQVVLGYWPEIRYQARQAEIAEDELLFFPIRGTGKYLSGHVGCTDTTAGRQAITEINQLLRTLPHEHLNQLYADWLDPERREDYLEQARIFFEQQAAQ